MPAESPVRIKSNRNNLSGRLNFRKQGPSAVCHERITTTQRLVTDLVRRSGVHVPLHCDWVPLLPPVELVLPCSHLGFICQGALKAASAASIAVCKHHGLSCPQRTDGSPNNGKRSDLIQNQAGRECSGCCGRTCARLARAELSEREA